MSQLLAALDCISLGVVLVELRPFLLFVSQLLATIDFISLVVLVELRQFLLFVSQLLAAIDCISLVVILAELRPF